MSLLEQVSTERIESAIAWMCSPERSKEISFVKYQKWEDGETGFLTEHNYTLPDLYRELARRHEIGIDLIRSTLDDAVKVFET